ncbi:MAG: hypothetical protein M5U31_03135 [Acidimicrobiia bacterium]|nr:hypothetical protein [Acidimicrobiia bacterium]
MTRSWWSKNPRHAPAALLAAVGLVAVLAVPVGAADLPTIEIDPIQGSAGSSVKVTGTCALASQDVEIRIFQNDVVIAGPVTVSVPGGTTDYAGSITVPDSAQAGEAIIQADCLDDTGPPLEVAFTVTAAPPPPPVPPAAPEPEPEPAAAPAPVAAQPTFTG